MTRATTTTYRAVVARQTTRTRRYTAATSRLRTLVTQRQRVRLTVPASRWLGKRVAASIEVRPVRRGRPVVLQTRRVPGRWVTVASARENRLGRLTRRWKPARAGTFRVRAVVRRRNGAAQALSAVSTLRVVDTTAPAAPTNLVASPGDGQVSLDWSASSSADVAAYRVYVASEPDALSATPVRVTGTSTVVTGLDNETTYTFVVTAVDTSGNESADSDPTTSTPTPSP